ncbi:MAG: Gfo/Idh/MocA family oxidoreductase [Planctomycetaceae bacterium]|nr:Gfo/Idh/MocA family oxidoreductase [Planctomycetaceae bacterium]
MKIGIIGSENSHSLAIAKTINIEKKIKNCSVKFLWGETRKLAQAVAKEGKIPNIVENPLEMLGKIDALIVDHRHPKYHLDAALPFIKKGIPVFIDKPLCFNSAKGEKFLKLAKQTGSPVTSFSVVPEQKKIRQFILKKDRMGLVLAGATYGVCDVDSPYGGIFFYGIHQVEMALKAFGFNVDRVFISRNPNGATGQLIYSDNKIITLNFIKEGCSGFSIGAVGEKGGVFENITFDSNPYLAGIKTFTRMFLTRQEPETHENLIVPIKILEALARSLKSHKVERVG